ncbi:MAG: radical SAM/SPASM domain-containing protein [Myxococcota bacterium]
MVPRLDGSYLVLETTNTCSLKCGHCAVADPENPHHASPGFLPLALAEALFADLAEVGARFGALIPFWLGEPLVHPEFAALYQLALRAAGEHGTFGQIEVHTNATHLDDKRVRVALNASPVRQVWHLTLDAVTRETHLRVKGRDRFEEVERNVEGFLRARARTGARWPRPVLQFVVREDNAHEAAAFRARWERVTGPMRAAAQEVPAGDDPVVFYRQLDAPTPEAQARANRVFRETMASIGVPLSKPASSPETVRAEPGTCACFWKSPVVGWDGRVTTCTRDNRLENALGSLHERRFSELWWGPVMAARRRRVAKGDYTGLAACAGCFVPQSANTTDITPAEIAAHA